MNDFEPIQGLIAPNLTPFNDDLSIATDLYVEHAHRLVDQGCAGLAPFGTTGEALSVGISERLQHLEALVTSGVDPQRLIPGTGLNNLPDTIELTTHAMDLGCRAVMTLPPFYFKNPSADGLLDYFEQLIRRVGPEIRIILYHIPQVAGVGFDPALVARLKQEHPVQIVGIKDSSGDWSNTAQLFEIADLAVYPGSEIPVLEALARGGPGCISATANINAASIVDVIHRHEAGDPDVRCRHENIVTRRRLFEEYAPIPAQKYLLARWSGEDRWHNVRPPLQPLDDIVGRRLRSALDRLS